MNVLLDQCGEIGSGGGLRTKPPKVKLPGFVGPQGQPSMEQAVPSAHRSCWPKRRHDARAPALWATVSVGVWASQAAWNLAAVSQPLKVEQHSDHSWPSMPAQPFSVTPQSGVSSREPGK